MSEVSRISYDETPEGMETVSDRFAIDFEGEIGSGGHSTVYKAYDSEQGIEVAAKVIEVNTSFARGLSAVEEADATAEDVPNTVTMYDALPFSKDGHHYIALMLEGHDPEKTGDKLIENGNVSLKAIEAAALDIALALDTRKAPHNDVKPSNMFLEEDSSEQDENKKKYHATLADFGHDPRVTSEHGAEFLRGTPLYIAPEALDGSEQTHKSDQHSLFLTLYEFIAEEALFDQDESEDDLDSTLRRKYFSNGFNTIAKQAKDIDREKHLLYTDIPDLKINTKSPPIIIMEKDGYVPLLTKDCEKTKEQVLREKAEEKGVPKENLDAMVEVFNKALARKPEDRFETSTDAVKALIKTFH